MFNSICSDEISLSLSDGLHLRFMYKGRRIVVHQATWSFREKIWVDDELVVNELGYRMASTHVLNIAGDAVEVTFGYRKRMTEIFLEAVAEGQMVHSINHALGAATPSSLLISLLLGGLVGAALVHLIG